MTSPRLGGGAVDVPGVGVVVVGGHSVLHTAELLTCGSNSSCSSTEDNGDVNWSWRLLPSMLEGRAWPAVAHFRGRVIVAGGNNGESPSVESLCLSAGVNDPGQWTRLSGLEGRIAWYPSLVVYNERLLLTGCEQEVLELVASPDSNNSTLDGCIWKPVFSIQGPTTELMVLRKSR
uniref:Uncharacterized protein n=1 Tax=Mesocestoides corti TaxID=53468 RepID=A0A5K3G2L0_MESCO